MRWQNERRSDNVEDRRGGMRGSKGMIGGGLGTVAIALIVWFLGGNPADVLRVTNQGAQQGTEQYQETAEENQLSQFVSVVLAETEDVWDKLFLEAGSTYRKPKLVLYSGQIESACGFGSAASGPFYCPGDEKVYIDLSFAEELKSQFNAPGDFALAYVVAHEVGHHVQNLLGISDKVASMRGRVSEEEYNKYSVRLELQADFFAGVWAHHTQKVKNLLEQGDIEEALGAASAVGDDKIQMQAQGYVVPDAFTHGTAEQRTRWFLRGYKSGRLQDGDTFKTREL